ncbi:MAG: hypothetical protein KY462_15660 [Actinobacteria bacterium]|nr:hypothetical protein [Actinomycetota bacterium]
MSHRRSLASLLFVVVVLADATGQALALANGRGSLLQISGSVPVVVFAVVGWMIVSRHPRHRIGWLFLASGTLWALHVASEEYARYATVTRPGLPGPTVGAWYGEWFWIPWLTMSFVFVLALFPDGRPLSPRWRRPLWFVGLATAITALGSMLDPVLDLAGGDVSLPNPIGVRWMVDLDDGGPLMAFIPVVFAGAVCSAVSLVIRYRRSQADDRQRIKLVVFAGVLVVASLALHAVIDAVTGQRLPVVDDVATAALPLAAGAAILRYRLYDIDLVISRTLVFGGLAAFITGIYVAIVVGVGTLIGAGDDPNLALSIVATALVAVAFQPVRERLTKLANRLVYGKRATPYEVLSRFSAHLGETVATDATLEQMARLLADGTGAARAQVWLKAGGQMRTAASWPSDAAPDFVPVVGADGSLPTFAEVDVAVPVTHQGQLLGALTVTKKRGEPVTPTEQKLVDDLASQAGLVVRNVQLTADLVARLEELGESRRRLVAAQDAERRRLERDLHDGAQQQLVALRIKLGMAKTLAEREDAPRTAALVEQVAADAEDAVTTLRELAHGIYPPLLAAEGLPAALAAQARKAAIPVTVTADGIGRYPQEVEAAVYFCVLEALNNVAKHAQATHAAVTLTDTDRDLTFAVTDDGTGFDTTTTPYGQGITNITDRLHSLGGRLHVVSSGDAGTTVAASLPGVVQAR